MLLIYTVEALTWHDMACISHWHLRSRFRSVTLEESRLRRRGQDKLSNHPPTDRELRVVDAQPRLAEKLHSSIHLKPARASRSRIHRTTKYRAKFYAKHESAYYTCRPAVCSRTALSKRADVNLNLTCPGSATTLCTGELDSSVNTQAVLLSISKSEVE